MKNIYYVTIWMLLFAGKLPAQVSSVFKPKPISADCDSAIHIKVAANTFYGFTEAPGGFGKVQEIKGKQQSKTSFTEEHHTAWYRLDILQSGEMTFEIKPKDSTDDYDFLLFKSAADICEQIKTHKVTPVRTNISRNTLKNKGVTGLSEFAKADMHREGPGPQFSRSIEVKKGEQYVLVVDNVYDNGSGHQLIFRFIRDMDISGVVLNEKGQPLEADIVVNDPLGVEIGRATSDKEGKYKMQIKMIEQLDYVILFEKEKHFLQAKNINTIGLKAKHINLKVVLPDLRKGRKYRMEAINFYGSSPELLRRSIPSVKALAKIMKKNPQMKILIEGHVNAPGQSPDNAVFQKLSEDRAMKVKTYLINKGVAPSRIQTVGKSSREMLFPSAMTAAEQEANRRVEIKVLQVE